MRCAACHVHAVWMDEIDDWRHRDDESEVGHIITFYSCGYEDWVGPRELEFEQLVIV